MDAMQQARFRRHIGIDYSGAKTADDALPGLRVYVTEAGCPPQEVRPAPGSRRCFSRRELADWLAAQLQEAVPTLVGIDHGFSFPAAYFEAHELPLDWDHFLDDFVRHWPTDEAGVTVEAVRRGQQGRGARRGGHARWRRLAEISARAKSVFHFDVPGSVAKSTHAGLPWLRHIRRQVGAGLHVWPFDGWAVAPGRSVLLEAYPALYSRHFPRADRSPDQHDAFSTAAWMAAADANATLPSLLQPDLPAAVRQVAAVEGWVLGVTQAPDPV